MLKLCLGKKNKSNFIARNFETSFLFFCYCCCCFAIEEFPFEYTIEMDSWQMIICFFFFFSKKFNPIDKVLFSIQSITNTTVDYQFPYCLDLILFEDNWNSKWLQKSICFIDCRHSIWFFFFLKLFLFFIRTPKVRKIEKAKSS